MTALWALKRAHFRRPGKTSPDAPLDVLLALGAAPCVYRGSVQK